MRDLGPPTSRRRRWWLLLLPPAIVLAVVLAGLAGLLPRGSMTAQVRIDTGDIRDRLLGVPYRYARSSERGRRILLRLSAMDPAVPPVWETIARYPLQGSNNPDQMEREFYMEIGALAELDQRLGRLGLNGLVYPYLPAGSVNEEAARDWLWSISVYMGWDGPRGWSLKPEWFDGKLPMYALADAAYRPLRLNDSKPDAQAYLWPDQADPSAVDDQGRTALHRAAFWDRPDLVSRMLSRGLDRDARDNSGWAPLHVAAFWGQVDVVEALVEAGDSPNLPVSRGAEDVWLWLPDDEGPLDGATPLDLAAYEGRLEVVRYLLNRGGRADAVDAKGRTALIWAEMGSRTEVADELRRAQATPGAGGS